MGIEAYLRSLKPGEVLVLITKEEKFTEVASAVFKYLTKKKRYSGVYLSLSRPYQKLTHDLKGVDWNKILCIDGISKKIGFPAPKEKNCIVLQGPTSLTEAGICLLGAIDRKNVQFIVLDSLSALLAYNNEKMTLRFSHYLVSKMKSLQTVGIMAVNSRDEEKQVISAIKDFADKVVKI